MRSEEKWEDIYRDKYIFKYFTPRLQKDLMQFPVHPGVKELTSAFIWGDIGTGKTVLAAQMMLLGLKEDYLSNEHRSYLFVSFSALLAEIKSTFNNPDLREHDIMHKYLDVEVLVLDDFLTTKPTDWVVDTLYYLINYRYEYELTTIITSNKELEELEELMGDQRITSRINRMCTLNVKKIPYDRT